ncbi:[FeFe] hydrogenase H-cluster maturation GTPase HydF [Shewanella sp. MMG014]|uniref:[FeFe] hydrogenase H-cluster maturation GTPase HydF n=1 Tax=Shewanella sp. MMG014 TaxID=2822691 RepID=UPI001B37659C|nr:[FeFe] hydrogenase H-cluster maturation GTPase HydF [Shewanella sp. MMG014]MBQ4891329.1 [FeFe] hydrogenase H-cluster maturation GTPase HydF [Shewanella sp. MMG014]
MCQGISPEQQAQLQPNSPRQPQGFGNSTPRSARCHIALIGRRNTGKSSLLNLLCNQEISIVSDTKGTTTDAVAKAYELLPLGPVLFYDTAGIDDEGALGQQRIAATRKVLYRADIALMVVDEHGLTAEDSALLTEIQQLNVPVLVAFNKQDIHESDATDIAFCQQANVPFVRVSAHNQLGSLELKHQLMQLAPKEMRQTPVLAGDLYQQDEHLVCVTPIDSAAPKGRIILPQVQVMREALDKKALVTAVQVDQLAAAIKLKPQLVVTDAQAIKAVDHIVPANIPLTTFSTLYARQKGDLTVMNQGAEALDTLADGDHILIAEACSHNVQEDDIGRVKIPKWIKKYSGKDIQFTVVSGHDFPEDLDKFKLVLHCGGCMINRTEMLRRLRECQRRGIPITNYGIAISKLQGLLTRVMAPFNIAKAQ